MASIPRGSFVYIILFVVLTLPFGLALIPQEFNSSPFSIYNEGWDGLKEFKDIINENYPSTNVETIIGSTNALNRLNSTGGANSGTLIIMGPKVSYDPTEAIAIMLYFLKGGRIIIADDFGTANDILYYFSLILQAISSADVDPLGLGEGIGTASYNSNTNSDLLGKVSLDLPPEFDPLLPYLQPSHPTGKRLWSMLRPDYSIAQAAQEVDPNALASSGFDILKSIVAISINKSVLIDTKNFVESPVQPILKPPQSDAATGTIVAPWITDWTNGVNEVVANYAAILSMKVKYPTNFTDGTGDVISYDEWFLKGIPPQAPIDINGIIDTSDRDSYNASHFETLWVPFGQFDLELPEIAGLGNLLDAFKPSFRLSALYSSQESWIEYNVTQAKNVNTISPDSSEWGNIEFPVAAMLPLGFDAAAPQLYLISDPSIFINKYLSETPGSNGFDPTAYDNRLFAENLLSLVLSDREGSSIYFDEGHLAHVYTNPILYMGLFFRFLDVMTMFPLIAPFVPITIIGLARRYAPKGRKAAAPLLMTRVEQYSGRSYFAFKMRWLLEYQNYSKGLDLIYRRVRRELTKRYDLQVFSADIAEQALRSEFPQVAKKNITRKLLEIENAINQDIAMTEDQFMRYYLILKEITDMIK